MLAAIKKTIFADDHSVLTQLPMTQQPGKNVILTHILVACLLYFVQAKYDLLGAENLKELSIWLLVTANSMICIFGSCRGFDRVTIVELFLAAFMAFYYKMHLIIPVIAIMLFQTYIRYDGSYGFSNEDLEPDTDSVFHEDHPDNWRNWMCSRGDDHRD